MRYIVIEDAHGCTYVESWHPDFAHKVTQVCKTRVLPHEGETIRYGTVEAPDGLEAAMLAWDWSHEMVWSWDH